MAAYYNEHDPNAAAWIRELMKEGLIAEGDVDERSIEDITPAELTGYVQCHFFAGIAVWSYALRQAGWPDSRECWTGSCPCQPFSAAGKGAGFADERHLWPAWFYLIEQLRPVTVFGEQVASKDGLTWLDLVHDDVEGIGYTLRAVDIPASSVGAPHRRQRLYFVAHSGGDGSAERAESANRQQSRSGTPRRESDSRRASDILADAERGPTERYGPELATTSSSLQRATRKQRFRLDARNGGKSDGMEIAPTLGWRGRRDGDSTGNGGQVQIEGRSDVGGMAVANGRDSGTEREQRSGEQRQQPQDGRSGQLADTKGNGQSRIETARNRRTGTSHFGPTNGFWRDAEWLYCTDGKYRAVEAGTFPLASRTPGRVGLLRGYGNSIVAPQAAAFIECCRELIDEK